MNIRNGIALLGLLASACSTNNQRSDLVITKVVEANGGSKIQVSQAIALP